MKMFKNTRNPILPLEYHIPDSEGHMMPDGKLYIYGSFDDREDVYCSEKYHVVSTPDMENWTIHDISLTGQQIPWFYNPDAPKYPGIDWSHPTPFIQKMLAAMADGEEDMKEKFEKNEGEKPALLFAPDCIEKDGKYYLYFCMSDDSEGVAVSEKPEGPFTNPTQLPCGGIDPAIFIDDDGQAYYYWGQLFSHGVKLNEDMISFDPENIVDDLVTEEEHFFHEGSSMRKIGDMYYYVYADMERGKPTSLGYSTGKSPLGPFAYQGIIIDNDGCDPESWNNHGSIENVNGQWYVFYHRCSRGVQQHRRLCIEPITIHEDGTIDEVKMTSQGVGEPFAPHEPMMGYQACQMKGSVYIGLSTEEEKKNGYEEKLMNLSVGDEMVFRYVKNSASWSETEITYTGSGKIRVRVTPQTDVRTQKEKKENAGCRIEAGEVICSAEGGTKEPERKIQTAWGKTEIPAGTYEVVLDVEESNALEILAVTLH
ncbi:family 43 glycosylhydrolase [Mediterraneibacter agrestimuris]|uniref:family 43 glycosylhydrolase n=1 Tax=Mediterraneibacter agrestimuris TaxID=2941333 RepID=UPI002040C25E|nr:family 43 glycosylhydrolase [Mediterraneibacter agrestimuris]